MKVNLHTPIEEAHVQIIPLIDVIFCVLSFFILASLQFTRQQAINVDLPTAKTGTTSHSSAFSQKRQQILPVTIDAIGQTYVEKQPLGKEQLKAVLEDYVRKNPSGVLVLNASRSATYNDVIDMLDLLRQVGGDRVSLGIIPGSSQPASNLPQSTSPYLQTNPSNLRSAPLTNTTPILPPIPNQVAPLPPTQPLTSTKKR
jgi:biopolymer transport protein ExbD